jgi:hypothetical protein
MCPSRAVAARDEATDKSLPHCRIVDVSESGTLSSPCSRPGIPTDGARHVQTRGDILRLYSKFLTAGDRWPGPSLAPVIEPGLGVGGRSVASLLAPLAVEMMFAVTAIRGRRAVSLPDREHPPKKSTLAHAKMGWTVFAP